jgi:hypothetical protein
MQLQNVQQIIESIVLSNDKDKWIYSWGYDWFASSKVYRLLVGHSVLHRVYKWLWKSNCQPKHNVFFWLIIKDRLSTRHILRRRNLQLHSYNCVFYNRLTEEPLEHLFLDCPFMAMSWGVINVIIPL